jgi:hypothetical protein
MVIAFLVALALAVIVLAVFGAGDRGTVLALRVTARWSFLLFWMPYAGSAIAKLCDPHLGGLSRYGRELGLAFASAQLVHVGLILWLSHVASGPQDTMLFFWVGIFCTYLLALFSLPQLDTLRLGIWRPFRTVLVEYIALVFAADFVILPLRENGLDKYPLTYLPFAVLLVLGVALRVLAFAWPWSPRTGAPKQEPDGGHRQHLR